MIDDAVDLHQFIIALLESAHRSLKQATDGLTDEQLYYQPTPETNSIAWLMWHLSGGQLRLLEVLDGFTEPTPLQGALDWMTTTR